MRKQTYASSAELRGDIGDSLGSNRKSEEDVRMQERATLITTLRGTWGRCLSRSSLARVEDLRSSAWRLKPLMSAAGLAKRRALVGRTSCQLHQAGIQNRSYNYT
jgi:hypothetical protein